MARATVTDVKIRFTGNKTDKPNSFCIFFGAKNKHIIPFKLNESCAGRHYLIATCDGGLDEKFKTKSTEFDISRITIYGTEGDIHFEVVEETSQAHLRIGGIVDMTPAPFGTDFNKWPVENPAITKKKLEETTMIHKRKSLGIKNIIFNGPATIIFWDDNTKTVVKCGEGDVFDPEKGVAMAVMKRALGSNETDSNYLDKVKKYLDQYYNKDNSDIETFDFSTSVTGICNDILSIKSRIVEELKTFRLKTEAMDIRIKMEVSGASHWELETFDRFCRKYVEDKEDEVNTADNNATDGKKE